MSLAKHFRGLEDNDIPLKFDVCEASDVIFWYVRLILKIFISFNILNQGSSLFY